MVELGISEGDSVYVLGYPMDLQNPDWHHMIIRSGIIARMRDMLDGVNSNFLLDAPVFPGNSGGPVILKPD